eukprot:2008844-Prymnesium_polylepis.1
MVVSLRLLARGVLSPIPRGVLDGTALEIEVGQPYLARNSPAGCTMSFEVSHCHRRTSQSPTSQRGARTEANQGH